MVPAKKSFGCYCAHGKGQARAAERVLPPGPPVRFLPRQGASRLPSEGRAVRCDLRDVATGFPVDKVVILRELPTIFRDVATRVRDLATPL